MLIRNSKHPEIIRERMVQRFEEEGIEGLENKSKAPHHLPHKTPKEIEERIREIAKAKKYSIGQDRIQSELRKRGD